MCGIAGIISNDSSHVSAERIKRMTDSLVHRGPDAEGHWINSRVTLGSRRLAIIDLTEAGNQPMHYLDRYTIIHNGEIYNYIELKDELRKKGYQFFSKTDTEIITAAYDHWKEECLDHFDGMFAFAIWDESEKELFAARDRFGEKPFFYFIDKEQFVFASEMKALWSAGIQRKVNLKLLFNYLTIGYVDNPNIPEESFFENISKLPAGSYLKLSPGSNRDDLQLLIINYWDIDIESENKRITDNQAIDRFGQLFQRSVKRRLRSDVPIGTSLSGGLDSSSVIATLHALTHGSHQESLRAPLTAFSAVFPNFEKDESQFAKTVADKFHLDHVTTTPDTSALYSDLEKLFYYQEEPFSSASIYAQYAAVDNTFATPFLQKPIDLGADIVMHSVTKYLGGHSDVIQGSLMMSSPELREKLYFIQKSCGAVPGPMDCFLVLRGIKTLHLRMKAHCENGAKIAHWLRNYSKIGKVYWPGFEDHPGYSIAKKQMNDFGGMLSFVLKNDSVEEAMRVLSSTKLFALAESLGGVESLINHPASMTHASIPKEERIKNGLSDSLIRLSVGIEDADDLIDDLKQAIG